MDAIKRITPIVLLFLSVTFPALAEQGTQTSSPPTSLIGILIIALCLSKQKQPIGGWLLYYFCQVFLGLLVTIVFVFIGIQNYSPSAWDDQSRYGLFMISTVPPILSYLCLTVASLGLLRSRTWKWVITVRYALIANIVCALVGSFIDYFYFPTNLPLDIYSLIFPTIFLPYFYVSKRVHHVFKTHDWMPEMATGKVRWYWWNKSKEVTPQDTNMTKNTHAKENKKVAVNIIEYTHVGFFRRLAAGIIDLFLLVTTSILIDNYINSMAVIALYWLLYFTITQSSKLSASLGKFALDIKVTDMAGNKLTFRESIIYTLAFYALSIFTIWTNFIPVALNKNRQALHDRICKVMVLTKSSAPETTSSFAPS